MLKKRGRRRLWAVLGTMLLAAALGVCALAASDVPKAVLNARESVVRIVTEGAMGSGFALSENSVYVVTNHHVIEGAETIEVIVDDTRWTTARVYVDLPGKDICILKTDKPLRGMPGLPLRSDAVETGLAVYALGYPGAADDFSREFATGVDSITVTDGIVSAVRQSRAEGLQTTWAIQTNTPISPGNSGGPLVDAGGRLVGINTFIMLEGQNVNGSIHVRELLTVLQQNDIPYRKAAPVLRACCWLYWLWRRRWACVRRCFCGCAAGERRPGSPCGKRLSRCLCFWPAADGWTGSGQRGRCGSWRNGWLRYRRTRGRCIRKISLCGAVRWS